MHSRNFLLRWLMPRLFGEARSSIRRSGAWKTAPTFGTAKSSYASSVSPPHSNAKVAEGQQDESVVVRAAGVEPARPLRNYGF